MCVSCKRKTVSIVNLNSHQSCQRRANQRPCLARDKVSDWLDARHSTFVRLGVKEPLVTNFFFFCNRWRQEHVSSGVRHLKSKAGRKVGFLLP
ncbi:hypothetical protein TNCV_2012322 [Trichonephila clavipes]|nr:hypothetical protein TNCV_2012322 [Trichonephila clavipes]